MSLHFNKLKLTLNTKNGIKHTVHTRYNNIGKFVTELLQRTNGNTKSITLEDADGTVELIGSSDEKKTK